MDALSKVTTIFRRTVQLGASDLHLVPGEICLLYTSPSPRD